jgi:hypothetical protein
MTPDGTGAGRLQSQKKSAHKKRRTRTRAGLTVTAVAGGAVACTGVAFGVAPIAEAFSMMIPVSDGSGGTGNNIQVNILEGNVFDTQLGILGGNVSNNATGGGIATGQGNGGSTTGTGNGNTTQINILSYNIWNPQVSIFGGNMSTNTTISNQATNNGNGVDNNSATAAAAPGGLLGGMLLGGMNGNGNTTQLAFLSGNITNPQFTLFGANISNNSAVTNVSSGNGNGSTQYLSAGYLAGTFFGMNGNGNTTQVAAGTSNILNPQFSFGAGNSSNNSSTTNSSSDNGNGSGTATGGGLFGNTTFFGLTGNGNSSQTSTGTGTIYNDQLNFGWTNLIPTNSLNTTSVTGQPSAGTDSVVTSSSTDPANTLRAADVVPTASPSGASGTPALVDTSGSTAATGPSAPQPSFTRITTVVNQTLGTGPKPLLTPIGTAGGTGQAGHFSLPEPIKKLIASIPGMPKADTSDSASAGAG